MTKLNKILLVLCAVFVAAAIATWERPEAPAPVVEPPYAVVYFICGEPQNILITVEPPIVVSPSKSPTPEIMAILRTIPNERVIRLAYTGPKCDDLVTLH